jgi:hypothetical protein
MKTILKPKQNEECTYQSDFDNKEMKYCPAIEIQIDFGFGSKYDGDQITLHLTDEEIQPLLRLIQTHGHSKFKESLKSQNIHPDLLKSLL